MKRITQRGGAFEGGGGEYCVPEMSLKVFWEVGLQLREKRVDWAIPYFLYYNTHTLSPLH